MLEETASFSSSVSGRSLWIATAFLAVLAFFLAHGSTVRYEDSDPGLMLLAAQSLVVHDTLALDPWRDDPRLVYDLDTDRRVRRGKDGITLHVPGPALLVTPVVWLAHRLGFDMLDAETERATQNLLSSLSCALLFVLLFSLVRTQVPDTTALVVAGVCFFGSSLLSTLGTALWSAHFMVVPGVGVLLCMTRLDRGTCSRRETAGLLALLVALLGVAALARPTAAFLGAGAVTFELARRRRLIWLLVPASLLILFLVLAVRDAPVLKALPYYYSPQRILPRTPLARGLLGTWLSPSRGLLVFSPFLVPVLVAAGLAWRRLVARPLFWGLAAWIGLHSLALATKVYWWGGHSYGPRLSLELMPGFALLAAMAWRALDGHARPSARRGLAAAFLALAIPALVLHTYVGLYQPAVRAWNEAPDIDLHRGLLFRWDHPQFLATEERVLRRHEEWQRRRLLEYPMGRPILPDHRTAVFVQWYAPEHSAEATWRWSRGQNPSMEIHLATEPARESHRLILRAFSLGAQDVSVSLGTVDLGTVHFPGPTPREIRLPIPGGLLRQGPNRIRFHVPGAHAPGRDQRILGLALVEMRIEPAGHEKVGDP